MDEKIATRPPRTETLLEILKIYGLGIIIAVASALFIRNFVIEAYRIPTSVMKPTLLPGDVIFVSKTTFGVRMPESEEKITDGRAPRYGEIVTFTTSEEPEREFIKRVVGLPGDTVGLKNGHLVFNGVALGFEPNETGICGKEAHPKAAYEICIDPKAIPDVSDLSVPENHVFLLGDLRSETASKDPWRVVPIDQILAKALWIWMSIVPKSEESWFFPKIRFDRIGRSV